MREWYTAQDIMGLPSVPKTDRGVRILAKKSKWVGRKRAKGKGDEYHLSSLPDPTRAHLIASHRKAEAAAARASVSATVKAAAQSAGLEIALQGMAKAAGFDGVKAARMHARDVCLLAMSEWLKARGIANEIGAPGRQRAMTEFVAAWNHGAITGYETQRQQTGEISLSSLYRWAEAKRQQGLARLAGNYGNRRGQGQIDANPELRSLAEWFCFEYPGAGPARFCEIASLRLGVALAESTVRRWLQIYRRDNEAKLLAVTNPDAWKDKFLPAFGDASAEAEHVNAIWELDGTPADVMLVDADTGELRRATLMACIDVYSRRLRYLVARTGTAAGIASLLRRCILDWGVPDTVHTDNGQDYVAVHLKTFLSSLGITQRLCAPFSPWEKPHVERSMRSMSHDLVELLPGFVGHNVAERSKIDDRKAFSERLFKRGETVELHMTAEQLQGFLDQWCAAYEQRAHSGEGMGGLSPALKAAQSPGAVKRIASARELDLLLFEGGRRRVGKKGIRHDNCTYAAPELGQHIGAEVLLRADPEDQGRIVVFDGATGAYLCDAWDAQAQGVARRDVAIAGRKAGKEAAAAGRELARQLRRQHNSKTLAQELLDARLAEAPNVLALPRPAVPHDTPALQAARDALAGGVATPQTVSADVVALRQQQALTAGDFDRVAETTDPRKVHAAWMRIEARAAAGEYVSPADREGLAQYRRSPTCKSIAETFEAFELDWRDFAAE